MDQLMEVVFFGYGGIVRDYLAGFLFITIIIVVVFVCKEFSLRKSWCLDATNIYS